MSDDRAFRILVGYNPDKERYWARVPELAIEVEGESRADAIGGAEKKIESLIEDAATGGGKISAPVDSSIEAGPITLELAGPVRRDLEYQARLAKLSPEALAVQLLARALGAPGERAPAPRSQPTEDRPQHRSDNRDSDNRGNNRDDRGPPPRQHQGGGRGRPREGYRPELDNQADFLAYVRDSEKGRGGRR
jgi:hypothetical protein